MNYLIINIMKTIIFIFQILFMIFALLFLPAIYILSELAKIWYFD